nr:hypothetical protein [Pandoraea apista]
MIVPHALRQKLVLWLYRPVAVTHRMPLMHALHFLKEDEIRRESLQPCTQLVNTQSVENGKALMDVVTRDMQTIHIRQH